MAKKMNRNHALWLGPVLAIAGFLSYYLYFVQFAALRNVPWVNFPLLVIALALSLYGLYRAWSGGWLMKTAGVFSAAFSLAIVGLFSWYVFSFSYGVPSAEQAAKSGTALPSMVLVADDGANVDVSEAASDKLILVFFRGYW